MSRKMHDNHQWKRDGSMEKLNSISHRTFAPQPIICQRDVENRLEIVVVASFCVSIEMDYMFWVQHWQIIKRTTTTTATQKKKPIYSTIEPCEWANRWREVCGEQIRTRKRYNNISTVHPLASVMYELTLYMCVFHRIHFEIDGNIFCSYFSFIRCFYYSRSALSHTTQSVWYTRNRDGKQHGHVRCRFTVSISIITFLSCSNHFSSSPCC